MPSKSGTDPESSVHRETKDAKHEASTVADLSLKATRLLPQALPLRKDQRGPEEIEYL
jgi:hypothetical protein